MIKSNKGEDISQIMFYKNGCIMNYTNIDTANFSKKSIWIKSRSYYENGDIESETIIYPQKGFGICRMYFKSGYLKYEATLDLNGFVHGSEKHFYENGIIKSNGMLGMGKHNHIDRWQNGNKKADLTYINYPLYLTGDFTLWNEKGQIIEERHYRKTEKVEFSNFKIGVWKYWDDNGNLLKKEFYENDRLVKEINYFKKGLD